jgi:hypothetical protein
VTRATREGWIIAVLLFAGVVFALYSAPSAMGGGAPALAVLDGVLLLVGIVGGIYLMLAGLHGLNTRAGSRDEPFPRAR